MACDALKHKPGGLLLSFSTEVAGTGGRAIAWVGKQHWFANPPRTKKFDHTLVQGMFRGSTYTVVPWRKCQP
eukprot:1161774-Pelagomonas_calceolata.AAC.7